eukprot:gene8125-8995_t
MNSFYGSMTTIRPNDREISFQRFFGAGFNDDVDGSSDNSVSSAVGFLFALNLLIGNGFLAVPFAFYHAGIYAGVISLVFVTSISCISSLWTLEVMSRAQGYEYSKEHVNAHLRQSIDTANLHSDNNEDEFLRSYRQPLPIYEVVSTRKFEFSELCDIFLGKGFKYAYIIALFVYMTFVSWSYATVVGTTWSSVIPWRPSESWVECSSNDFTDVYVPANVKCKETYWFYTALFGVIVIPLGCFELRGQMFVQVITAILRLVSILLMTGQVLYEIIQSDSFEASVNNTNWINRTTPATNHSHSPSKVVDVMSLRALDFKAIGWLWSIPVFIHAQIMQQNIPAISYQIKKPERLGKILLLAFVSSCLIDILYGSSIAWRFQGYTNENAVLNWVAQRDCEDVTLSAIAYTVLLLPSFELISLFPIMTVTLANNIFVCLYSRDTSVCKEYVRNSKLKLTAIRIIIGAAPIFGAMVVANLFYIVEYAGVAGVIVAFVFPAALQYKSRLKCQIIFPRKSSDKRTESAGEWNDYLSEEKSPANIHRIKEKLHLFLNCLHFILLNIYK